MGEFLMSEYKLYNLSDLKKNRYDIVQNKLLPVHSQTLTKFQFNASIPYFNNNVNYEISPEKEHKKMIRYGSHAAIG